jgi:hypothetical protein
VRRTTILLIVALSLAACGTDDGGGAGASVTPSDMGGMNHGGPVGPAAERPSTEAMLTIVTPSDGDVLGPTVDVEVELTGARVVQETSTDLRPDEGHIHVLLDDQLVSMTDGLEQTLRDLEPGLHVLKVEFVANDHAPFDPRVIEAVAFEVEAP